MRQSLFCAVLVGMLGTQAIATDLSEMSEKDRATLRDEVRAYLLENPEVIMEAIQVLKDRDAANEVRDDLALVQDNAPALFHSEADWVGGNKDGDITVVEFMDYRCGYCKKANAEVAELVKSDGNIKFVLKEYPILGEESELAARFAIAVHQIGGDDAYASVHETLMSLRSDITIPALEKIATDLSLDPTAIMARAHAPQVDVVIAENRALGAAMQVNGTPTFVVQKTLLRGYLPLDGMRGIVADERKS